MPASASPTISPIWIGSFVRTASASDHVLVTHAHADHASGAPAVAAAHAGSRFHKYPWPDEDGKYPVKWQPVDDGMMFDAGDGPLLAVHTPGHSPDHLAFWHEASRTIFSGDLVVLGGSVMIHIEPRRRPAAVHGVARTLDGVASARPAAGAWPAITTTRHVLARLHRAPPHARAQVIDALAAGHDTVPSIAESIYDGLVRRCCRRRGRTSGRISRSWHRGRAADPNTSAGDA